MSNDTDLHTNEEYELPSVEALLAGTLALMTGHAQSACARQRCLMSKKIAANLLFLSQHPTLSPPFKAVTERMRPHWNVLAQAGNVTTESRQRTGETPHLWHSAATRLQ